MRARFVVSTLDAARGEAERLGRDPSAISTRVYGAKVGFRLSYAPQRAAVYQSDRGVVLAVLEADADRVSVGERQDGRRVP